MSLVLDSLEIKNFRAFKHLRIEKLGRVNLIVGKNNVGKSSVLEALDVYAGKGEPYTLIALLKKHNELSHSVDDSNLRLEVLDPQELINALRYLFYGREDVRQNRSTIYVGVADAVGTPNSENKSVVINVVFPYDDYKEGSNPQLAPSLQVKVNDGFTFQTQLTQSHFYRHMQRRASLKEVFYTYVAASGLDPVGSGILWDRIALSSLELDVLSALRLIAPQVERISFVGGNGQGEAKLPKTKLVGVDEPLPLASLGEGMNRMLGIVLALVNVKDGMLLIDEVDTGLHYSVLPDLWKLIFEVAHRLNVQVFATSHSWDCIEAFQQAAADNTEEEGVLVRLENRKDGVGAVTFDERELAIVTREQIEVR